MAIQTKCLPFEECENLKEKWLSIENEAKPDFMMSWTWIGTWIDSAINDWSGDFLNNAFVIESYLDDALIALGILVRTQNHRHGFINSTQLYLHRVGDPQFDILCQEYNGLLCKKEFEADASKAAAEYLISLDDASSVIGKWDEIVIASAEPDAVDPFLIPGLDRELISTTNTYIVDLDNVRQSEQSYLSSLSKNTRYQINRSIKIYQKSGGMNLQFAKNAEEAFEFFTESADVHKERWLKEGDVSQFDLEVCMNFHKALMKESWKNNEIDLIRITIGNDQSDEQQYVGMLYNFIYNGQVNFYMSALTYESNPKLKPGMVAHTFSIEHYLDKGLKVYNFMAGDSRYKRNLGNQKELMLSYNYKRPRLMFFIEKVLKKVKSVIKKK